MKMFGVRFIGKLFFLLTCGLFLLWDLHHFFGPFVLITNSLILRLNWSIWGLVSLEALALILAAEIADLIHHHLVVCSLLEVLNVALIIGKHRLTN